MNSGIKKLITVYVLLVALSIAISYFVAPSDIFWSSVAAGVVSTFLLLSYSTVVCLTCTKSSATLALVVLGSMPFRITVGLGLTALFVIYARMDESFFGILLAVELMSAISIELIYLSTLKYENQTN